MVDHSGSSAFTAAKCRNCCVTEETPAVYRGTFSLPLEPRLHRFYCCERLYLRSRHRPRALSPWHCRPSILSPGTQCSPLSVYGWLLTVTELDVHFEETGAEEGSLRGQYSLPTAHGGATHFSVAHRVNGRRLQGLIFQLRRCPRTGKNYGGLQYLPHE